MQKIAFFIPTMNQGGAQKEVGNLLKYAPPHVRVVLILMNDETLCEIPDNVEVIFLEKTSQKENFFYKFLKLPYLAFKLSRVCQKHEIDTILSFLTRANYIAVLSKFFKNGAKIVINERSLPSKMYESGLNGAVNRLLMRWLFSRANKIIANSKPAKYDLENNYTCKDVFVFYNPIDTHFIKSVEPMEKKDKKPVFITIGRLHEVKNHTLLIHAMNELDGVLYIIGDGELKDKLLTQVKNENLQDKVFLLGAKSNPYKYLKSADIFVLTSLFEGFPTVLLEALACKLPIISSDCANGPREILALNGKKNFKNGFEIAKYGLLTKVNEKQGLINAMRFLLKHDTIRQNYRKISNNRSEDFNVEKMSRIFYEYIG